MMKLCSISSGSSGNCIYIGSEQTNILVDVGISGKKVEQGLEQIDVIPRDLDGILITHEHSDHVKGLGVMARRYGIPIYATKKTWLELVSNKSLGIIDESLYNEISSNEDFFIKDLLIHPFNINHDAVEPVCYTFSNEDKKISVATDLGSYDNYIKDKLSHSNILFIEANHDIKMLEVGKYPYYLKQRILSDIGHLSNEMSGKLIVDLLHDNLSHVILGHLSNENNYPDLAYESVKLELQLLNDINYTDIHLSVALRNENSDLIVI